MNVLVINAGSSSFKYQLINMSDQSVLCTGVVERIGQGMGKMVHKIAPDTEKEEKLTQERPFANHVEGMKAVVELITDRTKGVVKSKDEIQAIGHRVVMGGESMKQSVIVDENIKNVIREYFSLSPLHNPANLAGIETAEELFPGVPNVAVFDTEFHQSMPEVAYMYPLPYELYEQYRLRRYGFHGTSHRYVTREAAKVLGKAVENVNLITCHLGNGSSITAVRNGQSVDTSMGTTPLDGLMMGTRSGAIDPAIVNFLQEKLELSAHAVDEILNKQSGLQGICGMSDMRDIHDSIAKGDQKAKLALDMFVYRIAKTIASYYAVLGHIDALVFTAGIGENDEIVRAGTCAMLQEAFGTELDLAVNDVRSSEVRTISIPTARTPVLIVPTNEELEIAFTTQQLVK